MEGVRPEVLPPNREIIEHYFTSTWRKVCTLLDGVPPPLSLSLNPDIFKPYIEAEEARLSANLKAVNYIIDGSDTLSLITGVGRIEKVGTWKYTLNCSRLISVAQTVFPLLYLLIKRHYEIMRIMRTKIPDSREIYDSVASIACVYDAVCYRVDDLISMLSPSSSLAWYADQIDAYRHLFSPEDGSSETIPRLCVWNCESFVCLRNCCCLM